MNASRLGGVLRAASVVLLAGCAAVAPGPSPVPFLYSPYKHVNQGLDLQVPVILGAQGPYARAGAPALTWAFATGECGQEHWGGVDAELLARTNVPLFQRAGVGYVISTGGEGGAFTCAGAEGMAAFIRRYDSPMLLGIDFDIEAHQTAPQIEALVRSLKAVQPRHPHLRFSFTLATHAATDGSERSLNALGETVLAAIRAADLQEYRLNLMVMNYGTPEPSHCVPREGGCDMGRSVRQAVENVHRRHGIPLARIEVTPMLGENDVAANVFTPEDARTVVQQAYGQGWGGLHHWSLDRDAPCPPGSPRVSPTCSGIRAPAGEFARIFGTQGR